MAVPSYSITTVPKLTLLLLQVITEKSNRRDCLCHICGCVYTNRTIHILSECYRTQPSRNRLINNKDSKYRAMISVPVSTMTSKDFACIVLGNVSVKQLYRSCTKYKEPRDLVKCWYMFDNKLLKCVFSRYTGDVKVLRNFPIFSLQQVSTIWILFTYALLFTHVYCIMNVHSPSWRR